MNSNDNIKKHKLHPILPRFFAFLIDITILGISCYFFAKLLISHTNLNPTVLNIIGSAYCLIYFAMLNSHVSLGKTIGKMVCKIRVSDFQNESINISNSFARSSIFILPLCTIGYLEPFAEFSIRWTIIQSFLICITVACIYFAICNTNTQQALHDLVTKTQVLRNSQTFVDRKPIWKVHFYIISLLSIFIIAYSTWQVSQRATNDFSAIDPRIKNITLHSNQTFIGEASSLDTILKFDITDINSNDPKSTASRLLEKFSHKNHNFIQQQNVNKTQINQSIQFGLFRFEKVYVYDIVQNYGVMTLHYLDEAQNIHFIK